MGSNPSKKKPTVTGRSGEKPTVTGRSGGKPTGTGHSGEKPTGTGRSGGKPTGTVKSSATRPVSASKQKGKPPPSQGQCIVEDQMNRNEKMLFDQASELRAEINKLDEENKRLKAKLSENEQVEKSDNVMNRSHLEKQLSDLKNENEEIKVTIKEKNAEILKLQKDLKEANEQNSDNVMNRSHLEKQLSDLKNENEEIKVTIKEKNAEILKLQKDLKNANKQNRVLSKQNARDQQAHEQNSNFEKELKEKDEAMNELQEKCKSLQEQIDRQKSFKQYGEQPGSEQFTMPTVSDSITLSMSALSVRGPEDDDSVIVADDAELLAETSFAEDADEHIKDPCAVCFTNRNYPKEASHFCKECGLLGHFLCKQCLSFHKKFTPHKDVTSFVAARFKMRYM